jgi:DNA-binding SARP family transcriptional activator/Tfp pilus assembly protein PilF
MPPEDLRVRLLGPLEISVGDRPLTLNGRQRALCTALLLNANRVVSVDRLVDLLWDEHPPVAAPARIRSLIAEIRRAIGPDAAGLVVTRSPGYAFQIDPAQMDLAEFEQLFEAASKAAALRDWAEAIRCLDRALALWRGEPIPDLADLPERQRLAELRIAATEARLEAAVALGRLGESIAGLSRLVREHPHRERPHALLMQALHRDGRTAEALEVYATLRRALVETLGVEPSTRLSELHQQLLAGTLPEAAEEPALVPRQLPAATTLFVGRAAELDRLDALHRAGETTVVITGPAGAGKTTLALRWAHARAADFPDGQLFLDMRGFDGGEVMAAAEALPLLLQGLGCRPQDIPSTVDGQSARYRTLLAERRLLLVFDDVADAAQIRDLLPGTALTSTLVTSRTRLAGLAAARGARVVTCDVLTPGESVALIGRAVGAARAAAEPTAVARLAELCDHLPLALCVAASRIAEDDGQGGVGRLVAELSERGRLARLGADGTAVGSALDASYRTLAGTERAVLRSLGLAPGTGRSIAAIAAGAGRDEATTHDALRAAARLHLARPAGPGRFGWHDLIHEYAVQRLHAEEAEANRRAGLDRLLDHYLGTAVEAARASGWYEPGPPLWPAGSVAGARPFPGPDAAHAWFDAEWEDIAVVLARVAETGPRRPAWLLVDALRDLLLSRRPAADYLRVAAVALRAAELDADLAGRAAMMAALGRAKWRAADLPGAAADFAGAGRLAAAAGWPAGEAHAVHGEGLALKRLGRLEEAQEHYRRAADLYRSVGDARAEAVSLNSLGAVLLTRGRLGEAEEALHRALPLTRRTDEHLRALMLSNLGTVSRERAEFATALSQLDEGLRAADACGSAYARALLLEIVGHVHADAGRPGQARSAFEESVALARRTENQAGLAASLAGLAGVDRDAGRLAEAEARLAEAHRVTDRLGDAGPATQLLIGEGAVRLARGRAREALPWLERAGRLAATSSPLDVPRVRLLESGALAELGETAGALAAAGQAARLAGESGQRLVQARALDALATLGGVVTVPER